jgi:pilus assembly protein Flp/PilA
LLNVNRFMNPAILSFLQDESGPTAVEYAMMLALIVVVCIGAVGALTTAVDASFTTSANTISNATGN